MRIRRILTEKELLAISNTWNNLAETPEFRAIWCTFDWFYSWWKCRRDSLNLFVLVMENEEGRITAIVPLTRMTVRFLGIAAKRLGFIVGDFPNEFLIGNFGDEETIRLVLGYLDENNREWDYLWVRGIREDSPTTRTLRMVLRDTRMPHVVETGNESPYIRVDKSWQEYFKGLSTNFRGTLRNKLNRIEKRGEVAVERFYRGDQLEGGLAGIFQVSERSWQGANHSAISSPGERIFYTEFAKLAAEKGWLELYVLRVGKRPIAFEYNVRYCDTVYSMKWGYDRQYKEYSPGAMLKRFSSEGFFNRSVREIDLLGAPDFFKLRWTDCIRHHIDVTVYRRRLHLLPQYVWKCYLLGVLRHFAVLRKTRRLYKELRTNGKKVGGRRIALSGHPKRRPNNG